MPTRSRVRSLTSTVGSPRSVPRPRSSAAASSSSNQHGSRRTRVSFRPSKSGWPHCCSPHSRWQHWHGSEPAADRSSTQGRTRPCRCRLRCSAKSWRIRTSRSPRRPHPAPRTSCSPPASARFTPTAACCSPARRFPSSHAHETIARMATASAREGRRVLVVDGDTSGRRLSRLFGQEQTNGGLTELLAGLVGFDEVRRSIGVGGAATLDLITGGRPDRRSIEPVPVATGPRDPRLVPEPLRPRARRHPPVADRCRRLGTRERRRRCRARGRSRHRRP